MSDRDLYTLHRSPIAPFYSEGSAIGDRGHYIFDDLKMPARKCVKFSASPKGIPQSRNPGE